MFTASNQVIGDAIGSFEKLLVLFFASVLLVFRDWVIMCGQQNGWAAETDSE